MKKKNNMTEKEIEAVNAENYAAAREKLLADLEFLLDAEGNYGAFNQVDVIVSSLKNAPAHLEDLSDGRYLSTVEWRDLKSALTLPVRHPYTRYTGETEQDPLSGNPRPKTTISFATAPEVCAEFYRVRKALATFTGMMAEMAKSLASSTLSGWKETWLKVYPLLADEACKRQLEDDEAVELLSGMQQMMKTMRAEIAFQQMSEKGVFKKALDDAREDLEDEKMQDKENENGQE